MSVLIEQTKYKTSTYSAKKFLITILILELSQMFILEKLYSQTQYNNTFPDQDLKFQHITVADGLPQSTIKRIIQDHLGFLWMTTQSGLVKYDGYSFTTYSYTPIDTKLNNNDTIKSLSDRDVTELLEDQYGNIWVGTASNGLNKFNRENETFKHYRHHQRDSTSLSHDGTYTLYEDKKGTLWIGTINGLNKFQPQTETFKSYYNDPGNLNTLSNNEIYAMLEDRRGNFWVGTRNGLNLFNRKSGKVTRYLHNPDDPASISHNLIAYIYEDKSGTLWIGTTQGGLNRFDYETGTFQYYQHDDNNPFSISHNNVYALLDDHMGNFWVGTYGGGLDKFDRETGRFYHYQNSPNNPNSISGNFIRFIMEDHSGILWIGTWLNGLNKLDIYGKKFIHHQHNPEDENSLNNNCAWALEVDRNGDVWIGTDGGGLNKLNRETGEYELFLNDPDDSSSLSNNKVGVIYEDPEGILWIGTYGGGLNRLDRKNQKFIHYINRPNDPNSLSANSVHSIFKDSEGYLWVGTWNGGLNKFDLKQEIFTHYMPDDNNPGSISQTRINSIFEDSFGILWIGTDGRGLDKYNRDTDTFSNFYNPEKGFDILLNLYEDSRGLLWIGTYRGGLHLFDRSTGTTQVFTEKDGLPHISIKGILEDDAGNLWLSTERGLSKFNYEKKSFRNYDVSDGLQGSHFHDNAADKDANGMLFFGGNNGFNSFYPDQLKDNIFPPRMTLTNFKIFNKPVTIGTDSPLKKHINVAEKIFLHYWQNDISIEYAALHFSTPAKNLYAYKLENYEDDWRQVDHQRTATYTNLSPGEYVFCVKGSNSDGIWNEEGTSIKIIIQSPFWQSWWFILITAILFLGLVFFGFQRRLKNARMKAELRAAHKAQMSIMPQLNPQIEGFDISGVCLPASEVGGDFFEYIWLDEAKTKFTVAVGDVSGKGMSAAMMAVMASGMVNSEAYKNKSIKEILIHLNRSLYSKTDKTTFVALCLASLDIRTKELTFINAGLNEPLLKSDGNVDYLESAEPKYPLGGIENVTYHEKKIRLKTGDVLILFSDGISEARNNAKEFFGYTLLKNILQNLDTSISAQGIIKKVTKHIKQFTGTVPQFDDMTLVVIKITG